MMFPAVEIIIVDIKKHKMQKIENPLMTIQNQSKHGTFLKAPTKRKRSTTKYDPARPRMTLNNNLRVSTSSTLSPSSIKISIMSLNLAYPKAASPSWTTCRTTKTIANILAANKLDVQQHNCLAILRTKRELKTNGFIILAFC